MQPVGAVLTLYLYKDLEVDATANQYSAGAAQSANGTDWVIKTDTAAETAFIAPENMDQFYAKKLAADSYVLFGKSNSGKSENRVYTTTTINDWGVGTVFDVPLNDPDYNYTQPSKSLALISDVEFDANNYLVMFNDLFPHYTDQAKQAAKGTLILKSTDIEKVTLLETGIRSAGHDLIVKEDGYIMIGAGGLIAKRAKYTD